MLYMIQFLFETTVIMIYISYIAQIVALLVGLYYEQITKKQQVKYLIIPLGFILYIKYVYDNMEE